MSSLTADDHTDLKREMVIFLVDSHMSYQPENSCKWDWIRWIPAFVLTIAAGFKIYYSPLIVASDGLLSSKGLLCCVVFGELLVAALITFLPNRNSWATAACTFFVLFVVAFYASLADVSCNCFGSSLPSWSSIVIDISILGLCYVAKPTESSKPVSCRPVVFGLILGSLGVGLMTYRFVSARQSSSLRFLLADELIGARWPLGSNFSSGLSQLESGRWIVLVVRRDCEHCQELLAEHFEDASWSRPGERTALFMAGSSTWPYIFDQVSVEFTPLGSITWPDNEPFVASPAVFLIDEGVITSASDGQDSKVLIADLFSGGA